MKDKKKVSYKNLKVGQEIEGWSDGNWSRMNNAVVKNVNPAFVTLLVFGTKEETVSSDCMFDVLLSDDEYKSKYQKIAEEVVKNIQVKLQQYEIGYHEMWNAWVSNNPYEMAAYCQDEKIRIIGHCSDITPKIAVFSGDTLDIGICAEHEDGEKFWCHARSSYITEMLEYFHLKEGVK